jgi:hypothetical protein
MSEQTIEFFNTLPLTSENKVKIGDIIQACLDYAATLIVIDPSVPTTPDWTFQLQMTKGYNNNFEITKEEFLELGELIQELNASESRFEEIDENNDNVITYEQLLEAYKKPPRLIPQTSVGAIWLEMLKEKESLTDETEITVYELINYESVYQITHWWPVVSN